MKRIELVVFSDDEKALRRELRACQEAKAEMMRTNKHQETAAVAYVFLGKLLQQLGGEQ
jgi:hypothetical protein